MPAKRCPMCHRASESTAWACSCGYEFGKDVDTVRGLLRQQLRGSWVRFSGLAAVHAGLVAAMFATQTMLPVFAMVALARHTARAIRTIAISRESLRQLAPRQLPIAKLLTD